MPEVFALAEELGIVFPSELGNDWLIKRVANPEGPRIYLFRYQDQDAGWAMATGARIYDEDGLIEQLQVAIQAKQTEDAR